MSDQAGLEYRNGVWELSPPFSSTSRVNIGANQHVEIDKLFGPLAAHPVRVHLDYGSTSWVVECCEGNGGEDWVEKARFSCQTGMSDEGLNED